MSILQTTGSFFKRNILPEIPSKWRKRLAFGFEAISLHPVESLKANGRLVHEGKKRKTAETKIYRVGRTKKFLSWFPSLVSILRLVKKGDIVNVDFSDFRGRQVLLFSKQTKKGRAIPLFFCFLTYPIQKGSQNIFIKETIREFLLSIDHRNVHLVFDRGFMIPVLVKFLVKEGVSFTIRMRAGKQVTTNQGGKKKALRRLKEADTMVCIYGNTLRVIRSHKKKGMKEPWYLLTSDTETSANDTIKRYYHRFEIEEFFKDAKRLSNYEYLFPLKDQTFTIILWFLFLGYWIAWLSKSIKTAWETFVKQTTIFHENQCLLRFFFELLERERYQFFKKTIRLRLWEV